MPVTSKESPKKGQQTKERPQPVRFTDWASI